MQSVELPLIDYQKFAGSFKDPQPVVAKHPTSSWLYLSTKHLPSGSNRSNFIIDVDKNGNRIEFARQASRISVVSVNGNNWYIPNINSRNNVIRFFSISDGDWYEATIPIGYYDTPASLATAIEDALNAVGSSIAFSADPVPSTTLPNTYLLTTVGNLTFDVDPECSFCKKGLSVCLTNPNAQTSSNYILGPMRLVYTDYVDIHSSAITQYQKMRSITTEGRSSLVVRAYIDEVADGSWSFRSTILQNLSFAYRSDAVLASIDVQVYDANGDPLYISGYSRDTINIELILQAEL